MDSLRHGQFEIDIPDRLPGVDDPAIVFCFEFRDIPPRNVTVTQPGNLPCCPQSDQFGKWRIASDKGQIGIL
ncbi:hypothetical protein GR167_00775 [Rhodobacteraceae bacterium GS-10]|uniref:Uncharacterized protein n=1 Tax=Thalassovita mangrovi TaxID=2692236 RepID=A0A6L8LHG0_9RHOB|nr:hypothetical protein [Thalassovita mangrovi]